MRTKELTFEELKEMPVHKIFAWGVIENAPDGLYMTDHDLNRELFWVAKKGGITDWCIYCDWNDLFSGSTDSKIDQVKLHGNKVYTENHIKKLVPCTDEAFKTYRK